MNNGIIYDINKTKCQSLKEINLISMILKKSTNWKEKKRNLDAWKKRYEYVANIN